MATTETVRVVSDPKFLEMGGRPVLKIRFAVKAPGKRYTDWFADGLLWGKDVETYSRLAKGDLLQVTGTLARQPDKKNPEKFWDEFVGFRVERVIESPTFFATYGDGDRTPTPAAPEKAGPGPLDDLL